jgi:hypothetical protein
MSTKNNREDWNWFSLFDPNTGIHIPGIEGGFEEPYQVEEEYIEIDDEFIDDEGDVYIDFTTESEALPVFDDVNEDEE